MIKIFYDLETTGVDHRKHGIHQLSGFVEVDGVFVETFDIRMQPNPKAQIDEAALNISGVDELDLMCYAPMQDAFKQFTDILKKHIDRYDRKDKAWLVGFNNRAFDDLFLRAWFEQNGNSFFGAYFWSNTLDVMVLASQYLLDVRHDMPSFKLPRVAKQLGIKVQEDKLHDSRYDVELTWDIYYRVTQTGGKI